MLTITKESHTKELVIAQSGTTSQQLSLAATSEHLDVLIKLCERRDPTVLTFLSTHRWEQVVISVVRNAPIALRTEIMATPGQTKEIKLTCLKRKGKQVIKLGLQDPDHHIRNRARYHGGLPRVEPF